MLSTLLLPELRQRFSHRGLRTGPPPNACAAFPGIHPEFGNIEIYDDGDELTVVVGKFTHGHFTNYDDNLSVDDKERQIVDDVVAFLEDLFADRVVVWSYKGSGGWYYPEHHEEPRRHERQFVWSGPWSKT
jgi:hypothetical protein